MKEYLQCFICLVILLVFQAYIVPKIPVNDPFEHVIHGFVWGTEIYTGILCFKVGTHFLIMVGA